MMVGQPIKHTRSQQW